MIKWTYDQSILIIGLLEILLKIIKNEHWLGEPGLDTVCPDVFRKILNSKTALQCFHLKLKGFKQFCQKMSQLN